MKYKLFTAEFLEKLQENCGALSMVDHYINDQGMSFHDAILRFANHHNLEPEYCDENYKGPNIQSMLCELIKEHETLHEQCTKSHIPNQETIEALEASRRGEGVKAFESIEQR